MRAFLFVTLAISCIFSGCNTQGYVTKTPFAIAQKEYAPPSLLRIESKRPAGLGTTQIRQARVITRNIPVAKTHASKMQHAARFASALKKSPKPSPTLLVKRTGKASEMSCMAAGLITLGIMLLTTGIYYLLVLLGLKITSTVWFVIFLLLLLIYFIVAMT